MSFILFCLANVNIFVHLHELDNWAYGVDSCEHKNIHNEQLLVITLKFF